MSVVVARAGAEVGLSDDERVRLLAQRVAHLEAEAEIARRLAGFFWPGPPRERLYRFIESEAQNFALGALCKVCGVSRSAYYSWRKGGQGPSRATLEEAWLANRIYDIWAA